MRSMIVSMLNAAAMTACAQPVAGDGRISADFRAMAQANASFAATL